MKKIFYLLLTLCLCFSAAPLHCLAYSDTIRAAAENISVNTKTDVLEKFYAANSSGISNDTCTAKIDALKNVHAEAFPKNDAENDSEAKNLYDKKAKDAYGTAASSSADILVTTLAVSYYSGTTIPTYTSVTGRSLYETYTSADGKYIFYSYIYDVDDHFDYINYLISSYSWSYYSDTTADDSSYATIYLTKGSMMLSITANFRYGLTTILFEKPTATISPTSISLNINSRTMIVGNTYTLEATISPSNATNKTVTWSSSNTAVVSVTSDGVLTAKKAGSATITAKTSNGKKATCAITVKSLILDYYPDTIIPTFSCVTGRPLYDYSENDSILVYEYTYDVESHADYLVYLEKNGWTVVTEETAEDYSYFMVTFAKNGTIVLVDANFARNKTAVAYLNTKISLETVVNGNTVSITPKNIPQGSRVILACYSGSELTDLQFFTYDNESVITFTTYQKYDKMKIFVRDSENILFPLCDSKKVSLG